MLRESMIKIEPLWPCHELRRARDAGGENYRFPLIGQAENQENQRFLAIFNVYCRLQSQILISQHGGWVHAPFPNLPDKLL